MAPLTIQRLDGGNVEHGPFRVSDRARSVLLSGFDVDVAAAFSAGKS